MFPINKTTSFQNQDIKGSLIFLKFLFSRTNLDAKNYQHLYQQLTFPDFNQTLKHAIKEKSLFHSSDKKFAHLNITLLLSRRAKVSFLSLFGSWEEFFDAKITPLLSFQIQMGQFKIAMIDGDFTNNCSFTIIMQFNYSPLQKFLCY